MEYEDIKCDLKDSILTIKLNRPEFLNAWTHKMESELKDAMNRASSSSEVRVIILTGEGRGFCAGATIVRILCRFRSKGTLGQPTV